MKLNILLVALTFLICSFANALDIKDYRPAPKYINTTYKDAYINMNGSVCIQHIQFDNYLGSPPMINWWIECPNSPLSSGGQYANLALRINSLV